MENLPDTRHQGTYDVARAGWCADYNEPSSFLNMMLSDSSSNTPHYKSAEFDKLMANVLTAKTKDERAELSKAEVQLDKDSAIVPLYYYVNARLVKPYVGVTPAKTRLITCTTKPVHHQALIR